MASGKTLHVSAPAKVNLFLQVLSRREDGYHELLTWMQKVSLADTLQLNLRPSGITLHCPDSDLPEDDTNLAFKAADIFFKETGILGGIEITLRKNIPLAAGLGGGSSDAAAVLNGLNVIYDAGLSHDRLMRLGLGLGADVPFFVADCQAALAGGVGEKLQVKQSLTDCSLVLVNPGFPVSTKWVFENFDSTQIGKFALTIEGNPYILGPFIERALFKKLYNDLENVTIERYPVIGEIKEKLNDYGAMGSLMSGSGPTVFGIFDHHDSALSAVEDLDKEFPGKVFYTHPLSSV
ncbi:MAG: 4-(cytidine 5'-diphospho)-2-C-methyl-D-erythritol kinase [Desulfobulbaceae bacterium]|nr:4-(cytidine 5'-diphospho)-2-C-methyl-D-erythritol kinase [Desulfobulbaceae bacterium]